MISKRTLWLPVPPVTPVTQPTPAAQGSENACDLRVNFAAATG